MTESRVLWKYANHPACGGGCPPEVDAEDDPRKGLLGRSSLGDLAALAWQAGFVLTCGACLYTPE